MVNSTFTPASTQFGGGGTGGSCMQIDKETCHFGLEYQLYSNNLRRKHFYIINRI